MAAKANLSPIYHVRYEKLHALTNSNNKAVFLCHCLYWWQVSTYTLKNTPETWFTRSVEEMAVELSLSARTVNRYLNEMEEAGLIARLCKRSFKKEEGRFSIIRRLYLRPTEQLLSFLGEQENKPLATKASSSNTQKPREQKAISNSDKMSLLENDKMSFSITNKEKKNKEENNNIVNSTVNLPTRHEQLNLASLRALHSQLLNEEQNNHVKGMLFNLLYKQEIKIQAPIEQLFAEIEFTLTNPQQLKTIDCFKDKLNIISKLLRESKWQTPKGFYTYTTEEKDFPKKQAPATKPLENLDSNHREKIQHPEKEKTNDTGLRLNERQTEKNQPNIQTVYPVYPIEKVIGDRISEKEKNYIKKMLLNNEKEHQIKTSAPEQVFAEVIFSVLHEPQLKNVETFQHRVNIIAKLMRQKRWCTPKGFYTHADYGQHFSPVAKPVTKQEIVPNQPQANTKEQAINKQLQVDQEELKQINTLLSQERASLEKTQRLYERCANPSPATRTVIDQMKDNISGYQARKNEIAIKTSAN